MTGGPDPEYGKVQLNTDGKTAKIGAVEIADASITNAELANSTIQAGKISFFKSTEQTGTGAEQNIAHGLGRTPALVIVFPTEGDGNAFDIAEGTHDATNVKITTGAAVKFKVVAL